MESLRDRLLRLELAFMDADQRQRPELLADLLTEDFLEFGSSGRVYGKTEVLAFMRASGRLDFAVEDFRLRELAPDCALATYRVSIGGAWSLRSSVWVRRGGGWQMAFHQGTALPGA